MGGYNAFIQEHIALVSEEGLVALLRERFSISTLEALEAIDNFIENN